MELCREPYKDSSFFTLLNISLNNVLNKIKDKPFFKKPRPMVNPNPNSKEYCNYHKAYGHTTRNCRNLKEFIKDLLNRGHC